jgi:hypothetical protein
MKKFLCWLILTVVLVVAHKYYTEHRSSRDQDTSVYCRISKADTTYTIKVEATYPAGIGEREYTAKEINGKKFIAMLETVGKMKPANERRFCGFSSTIVTYVLMDNGKIIVSKESDVIAPLTEEAAKELLTKESSEI